MVQLVPGVDGEQLQNLQALAESAELEGAALVQAFEQLATSATATTSQPAVTALSSLG
jgi:hypothetical protein